MNFLIFGRHGRQGRHWGDRYRNYTTHLAILMQNSSKNPKIYADYESVNAIQKFRKLAEI